MVKKMEIVTLNAEKELVDFISSINTDFSSWECVHIEFSKLYEDYAKRSKSASLDEYQNVTLKLVKKSVQEPLKNEEGKIFLCFDSDAFAIFKPSSEAVMDELRKVSETFVAKDLKDMYKVYNLGKKKLDFDKITRKKTKQMALRKLQESSLNYTLYDCDNIIKSLDFKQLEVKIESREHRIRNVVLVVDDDEMCLELSKEILPLHCEVHTAKSGNEAIVKYLECIPDILLLDIHMPDENGISILEQIKEFDPASYVLIVSGDSVTDNVLDAKKRGAVGFITKPFTRDIVNKYISQCSYITRGQSIANEN